MIRSTCAALFAFALATVLVTSPQSIEAKDRRCCPQPVYCQPQSTCCRPIINCCPKPSYCQPSCAAPSACCETKDTATHYWCAYFEYANWGTYSDYYAPHCTNEYTPISISASNSVAPDNECERANPDTNPFCLRDPCELKAKAGHAHANARLENKLNPGHRPADVPPDASFIRRYVGTDEARPRFVAFRAVIPATGQTQLVVAQIRQYDIIPTDGNPAHIPIRLATGQEVRDKAPNDPDVLGPKSAQPIAGAPWAYRVVVSLPATGGAIDVEFVITLARVR